MAYIANLPLYYMPLCLSADVGLPGTGKTAFAVLKGIQAYCRGAKLYSNVIIHDEFGNDLRAEDGRLDADDPGECLAQLEDVFRDIRDNESWNELRYLILDEFSSIADSQTWKNHSWTSQIWKQLAKLNFTGDAIDQNFSRIYNGWRDLVVYKYVITDVDINGSFVPKPWCNVVLGKQSPNDHTRYTRVSDFYINLSLVYDFYLRHQLMYFDKKGGKNGKR
ncbi:hypothetical protein [Candidatus Methanoperedens nitratireducens]|nr:hypothetical protein [Candidatus Methanoperedens nitroreducens]